MDNVISYMLEAEREANRIVEAAERKAQEIRQEAQQEGQRIVADAREQAEREAREVVEKRRRDAQARKEAELAAFEKEREKLRETARPKMPEAIEAAVGVLAEGGLCLDDAPTVEASHVE